MFWSKNKINDETKKYIDEKVDEIRHERLVSEAIEGRSDIERMAVLHEKDSGKTMAISCLSSLIYCAKIRDLEYLSAVMGYVKKSKENQAK